MTHFHKEMVRCPYCLNEEEIPIWDKIDAVTDPDLKERLLRKSLQVFDCRNCGRKHLLSRPILYRDDMAGLLIWCDPAGRINSELPVPAGYRLRLTNETNQLIETIHLFEAGLDDRLMEVVKLAVLAWQNEEIRVNQLRFLSADADRILFLALGDDENWYQLPVAFELYAQLKIRLSDQLSDETGWLTVDETMATPLFERLLKENAL